MINDIYILVQDILNKNGRGIVSPARFVHCAENSQLKLLGNAINEYKLEKGNVRSRGVDNYLKVLEDVINIFTDTQTLSRNDSGTVRSYHLLPSDYMSFGDANLDNKPIIEIASRKKAIVTRNYHIPPTESNPYCYIEGAKMYVLPSTVGAIDDSGTVVAFDEVELSYYRYPVKPNWTYVTVGSKAVFNESDTLYQDFELPYSMFNKLVIDILSQLGVHIRDEVISQYTSNEDSKEYQKDNAR